MIGDKRLALCGIDVEFTLSLPKGSETE